MAQETLRFVVQRHQREIDPHFDIMLERDGKLLTWASRVPPKEGEEWEVRSLPDHRLAYLDHEGEVSGGRGSVTIWDRGTYKDRAWSEDRVDVDLSGEKLQGRLVLTRVGGDRWVLVFRQN